MSKIIDFEDPMDIKQQDDAMLGIKVVAPQTPWEVTECLSESKLGHLRTLIFRLF